MSCSKDSREARDTADGTTAKDRGLAGSSREGWIKKKERERANNGIE